MKNLTKLFICALAMFSAYACSGSSSPSDAVMSMYGAAQAGDYEKAASYVYITGKDGDLTKQEITQLRERVAKQMEADCKRAVSRKGDIVAVELLEEEIGEDGNTAKVKIKLTYSRNREEFKTRNAAKDKGTWWVDL